MVLYRKNGTSLANLMYNTTINNNMKYKGHTLWWDYVYSEKLKEIITSDNEDTVTLEYIYNNFNSGKISQTESKKLIDELKNKFENIVYEHIEEETKKYNSIAEWDVVNEPANFQYFKYYLYDEKVLTDGNFLNTTIKESNGQKNNDEYNKFLANCFEIARKNNAEAKLIINDTKIKGNFNSSYPSLLIDLINGIKKYSNNIDSLGIQSHINNNYKITHQSIYNQINYALEQTGLTDAIISEYDNYQSSKLTSYTKDEKKTKANYLRDMLIMAYSNTNISEFTMWVYYSDHFCDEEREAYANTVYNWLNYTAEGKTGENGYYTRLYKGTYTATVTLPNGKTKSVDFTVSDDSTDTIEIIVEYEADGKESVEDKVKKNVNSIIVTNNNIKEKNEELYENENINKAYTSLVNSLNEITANTNTLNQEKINAVYDSQYAVIEQMISEYNNGNISISSDSYKELLSELFSISSSYQELFNLYCFEDDIENETTKNQINAIINRYNDNTDIEIGFSADFIAELKQTYDGISNYINKRKIENESKLISKILENDIKINADNEAKNIMASFSTQDVTDQDVIVTINNLPSNSYIVDYSGKQITFSENATKSITINIRGYEYNYDIEVSNIDKTSISSDEYSISESYIKNISKNTKATVVVNNLNIKTSYKLFRNGSEISNTDNIATGDILKIGSKEYTLIVKGDITQTSNATVKDLAKLRGYLLGKKQFNEIEKMAADLNNDSKISIKDLAELRAEVLK